MKFRVTGLQNVCVLTVSLLAGLLLGRPLSAQNTTSLAASLTPTVLINGPVGSMQQVQYSTNAAGSNWITLGFVRVAMNPQPFYDSTAAGDAKRFYRTVLANVADTNLVWIPSGDFMMGSPESEEGHQSNEAQVPVTLTKGFFMGRYEVRNAEWLETMNAFPFTVSTNHEMGLSNFLQRPVRYMFYGEATNYCAARTLAESNAGKIPAGWQYRLPTEAEWEYACRAGTATVFSHGNTLRNDDIRQDANFDGHYPYPTNLVTINPILLALSDPAVVGGYRSNAFGLYDMHGNVQEWCLDAYPSTPAPLPGGHDPLIQSGSLRIIRGGAFYVDAGAACRSAYRTVRNSFSANERLGFRVVLAPAIGP